MILLRTLLFATIQFVCGQSPFYNTYMCSTHAVLNRGKKKNLLRVDGENSRRNPIIDVVVTSM